MGNISYLRKRDIPEIDWMASIDIMDTTAHVSKSVGRLQSPHHPSVYIEIRYGKAPIFHGFGGVKRELDAVELCRYLLDWKGAQQ